MSSKPCRFYTQPSGCYKGNKCPFSHSQLNQSRAPSPSSVVANRSKRVPSGVCRYYWASGSCREEFKCRFSHMRDPSSSKPPETTPRPVMNSTAEHAVAPFLTTSGLDRVIGNSTDAFFSQPSNALSPSEAQRSLQRFLHNNFRFTKAIEVYAFMAPLNSSISSNHTWLLLTSLATDNGLPRISAIINWKPISATAGMDPQKLSFQRAWVPLLRFLSSDIVVKSTLHQFVNKLYMCIMNNFEVFSDILISVMDDMFARQSFIDPMNFQTKSLLGSQVLAAITGVLFECLTRFKNGIFTYPQLAPTVRKLEEWFQAWAEGVEADPPLFDNVFADKPEARDHIVNHLRKKIGNLVSIVDREQARIDRQQNSMAQESLAFEKSAVVPEGLVAMLQCTFDGPGILSGKGVRHDNDHTEIHDVRIAPTHQELMSTREPFLPASFYDAPHHLPSGSMERLLDIQFRLLREELTGPLRTSIQFVRKDLLNKSRTTRLSAVLAKKGGKYRGGADSAETVLFNVYTGVRFNSITPNYRGMNIEVSFDAPPGRARQSNPQMRAAFWMNMSGKRLMQGGLVALIWYRQGRGVDVHLGVIASSSMDLAMSARQSHDRISARIVFFDIEVELRILDELKRKYQTNDTVLLVEASVMFESIRPFLEALKTAPETVPLQEYLVHRPPGYWNTGIIEPPLYARFPRFAYRLGCLFDDSENPAHDHLRLVATDPDSIQNCRIQLKSGSRLDPSQVDAVVDALTREVALIQGPPGTGKSFTGVELLRVLVPQARPILMIAFTNHALDHLLSSVLDAKITKKIVRLGTRSADERISEYSIENLDIASEQSRLKRSFQSDHRELKSVQTEIRDLMSKITKTELGFDDITSYMELHYPEHHDRLLNPPLWIQTLIELKRARGDDNEKWQTVRNGRNVPTLVDDDSSYAWWYHGRDLDFLQPVNHRRTTPEDSSKIPAGDGDAPIAHTNKFQILSNNKAPEIRSPSEDSDYDTPPESDSDSDSGDSDSMPAWQLMEHSVEEVPSEVWKENPRPASLPLHLNLSATDLPVEETVTADESQYVNPEDPFAFFKIQMQNELPDIPSTDQPLSSLLEEGGLWAFSHAERQKLHRYWIAQAREVLYENCVENFQALREKHKTLSDAQNQERDEVRRNFLRSIDIIGCTTTGAAKYHNLLKGIEPRVMLVEEAGQVLEAHILGSLLPSIEHLILIGDPLQLRPTLNNFKLSVDSRLGNKLYKFDMSLMERLSSSGFPMSRIDVQRRMRPSISQLIRNPILYPGLEDHDLVKHYPDVRGFTRNVFFLTHNHPENDGNEEDPGSKYNTYEVKMIKDMVLYLLRQGCYTRDGDIVVLCAYLGQLAKVRDALSQHVALVIDDSDQVALDSQEEEKEIEEPKLEQVQVSKRVRLRTVDNYQGEEGKVVILSLVRNGGNPDDDFRRINKTVGFLKSKNRTNVAISRAKHGLYILGNAMQLASKSEIWRHIIEELQRQENVGEGFPIACHRHPEKVVYISEPGHLPCIAPDGGCLESCNYRLQCGHVCPYKCHPDDANHISVTCFQSCRKLCTRGHPCSKKCSDECGQCLFPIPNITLPCGHVSDSIPCHMLDNLEAVQCDVEVTKHLPKCEHTVILPCYADPANHPCVRPCGGIMACCGRDCVASCHECQAENLTGLIEGQQITREKHRGHPCKKPLYCGHECPLLCTNDHECINTCNKRCRQKCSHAQCRGYCSTPCAPCQEPCTWLCPHLMCPLPCGSVCSRLPCDKRCEKMLKCGHRCPSVCGEDCSIQLCPICAPKEDRETVVDLILYLKMEDLLMDEESLDNILITLPDCCHAFTVETLDGICGLEEYYIKNSSGKWTGLRSPQNESGERRRRPMCPTCRTEISSPRYGRIFKSANLDILERNIISHMSNRMNDVQGLFERIVKEDIKEAMGRQVKPHPLHITPKQRRVHRQNQRAVLKETQPPVVHLKNLTPDNQRLFSVSPPTSAAWGRIVRPLTRIYKDAATICNLRSAHTKAWEAAFSFLFDQEMDKVVADPSHAPRRPREYAMRMARLNVGTLQPRADKRFQVEAIWITLQIRLLMVEFAYMWLQNVLWLNSPAERQAWGVYTAFLLETCLRDVEMANTIAKESESRRQITTSVLFGLRIKLEQFRLDVEMSRQSGTWTLDERTRLAKLAAEQIKEVNDIMYETVRDHYMVLPHDVPAWIRDNFSDAATAIQIEWNKLERAVVRDTFYEPVSLDEKMAVVKAFNFGHTGHFYNCPNGHTFVITECGGAMEVSRCPECGQSIGGQNHRLDASNSRAVEFENLASQAGSTDNPWGPRF
ncbi:hypothetical protein AMATHDRAFT_73192 [Amanita thiersii Skay4041]|uniref:P-loop containing nucleoside triphosphate hydrolase protein n=1 Tax=Amanita thiersii Skay4041 TaxID=703135 RepID=A0A2A9NZ22_9AGAR|nr:hypothetical protein AMATHDRAFT_73192 [Amanita thiersii Skay4041]